MPACTYSAIFSNWAFEETGPMSVFGSVGAAPTGVAAGSQNADSMRARSRRGTMRRERAVQVWPALKKIELRILG